MESVTEEIIVCPVGSPCARSLHGDEVNESHYKGKYRKSQPTVSNDLVDLV